MRKLIVAADVLLLGRRTYESFYGAWPGRAGPFADEINGMPKYVASTTVNALEWETASLLTGPVPDAVADVKHQGGGPILVAGSRTLVQTLLGAGLVDGLNLQVFPLLLGSGARLFPQTPHTTPLELVSSTALSNGVLLQTYRLAAS